MQLRILSIVIGIFIGVISASAQYEAYPIGYFKNPLGIPMELTANFGELRTDHWHMGLDLRTEARENLPVYASAAGYISAIGVRPQSFGRFIVIAHPNGYSTLYAHLNDFYPALETYVTKKQYEKESWAIELSFTPEQFPVLQGQYIANSGNTGGSQGAHLHFEIIDTRSQKRLNPLLFAFPLVDDVPPVIKSLTIFDRSVSIYGQNGLNFPVKKTDSGYIILAKQPIKIGSTRPALAISAIDQMAGSPNPNGIYAATFFLNGVAQIKFQLDSLDYDETGYVNAQIDYEHKGVGGKQLQQLAPLPGEKSGLYKKMAGDGILNLSDTAIQSIRIEVSDVAGNKSILQFLLQFDSSLVKKEMPVKNQLRFSPNIPNKFSSAKEFVIEFPASALYDTMPVVFSKQTFLASPNIKSYRYQLNDPSYPIHNNFIVSIKPSVFIEEKLKSKILMMRSYGGAPSYKTVSWNNELATAKFDELGYFQLVLDTVSPNIKAPAKGDTMDLSPMSSIILLPIDNYTSVRNFRAELDDKWIRFTNDKSRYWIYKFDELCPFGTHHLKVSFEDLAGNVTVKDWWFKRGPYTPPPPKKHVYKKGKYAKKNSSSKKKSSTSKKHK